MSGFKGELKSSYRDNSSVIANFPDAVMIEIFKKLSGEDLLSAFQVCTNWSRVLNEHIGFLVFVGKESKFTCPRYRKIYWSPLEILESGDVGINHCIFGDLSNTLINSSDQMPIFWNPDIVSTVEFFGEVDHHYFKRLIDPLHFLKSLTMHLSAFMFVDFEDYILEKLWLVDLNLVFTSSIKNLDYWTLEPCVKFAHCNLVKFLKKSRFPRVNSISLRFPYYQTKLVELSIALNSFCHRHVGSLKKLNYELLYQWELYTDTTEILAYQPLSPGEEAAGDYQFWNGGQMQLDELVIINKNNLLNDEELDINSKLHILQDLQKSWNSLLESQIGLTRFLYNDSLHSWNYPDFLLQNNPQLVDLYLVLNNIKPINCAALKNCVNLKFLKFEGVSVWPDEEEIHEIFNIGQPVLINAHEIPENLQVLELIGILVSVEEITKLLEQRQRLETLKNLRLYDIATSRSIDCGLTMNTVHKLIFSRIDNIIIRNSLNVHDLKLTFQKWRGRINRNDVDVKALLYLRDCVKGTYKGFSIKDWENHPEYFNECHPFQFGGSQITFVKYFTNEHELELEIFV